LGLFGRGKRDTSGSVCSECGRSLLAGELTHRVVDEDGNERLICSLCGTPSMDGAEAHVFKGSPPSDADEKERSDSDTFWRALKEKDAQIEHLEARLARSEAERQELAGQLALLQAQVEAAAGTEEDSEDEVTGEHVPAAEPAAELPYDEAAAVAGAELPYDEAAAVAAASETPWAAPEVAAEPAAEAGEDTASMPAPGEAAAGIAAEPAAYGPEDGDTTAAPIAEPDEGVSSLTLLQRGVDILNVSPVPKKVADTSADLGVPQVHVGFDGQKATVTFLWSLGWYRFAVDIEGAGSVRLEERGYEDRPDLQPNAAVRADGTVQLAPAQISRAARGREAAPPADEEAPAGPRTPRDAAERPPEIVSQSLLGQRTDDEKPSWEETQARDFNW